MSHARVVPPIVTIAAFDAFVAAQPDDGTVWELVDGHIVGTMNPNARHGQIALNVAIALEPSADKYGCHVNVGGFAVQGSSDSNGVDKTIPDISVRCGVLNETSTWTSDPTVIFEILSPSTMDYDRGLKLRFYKSISSLQDIVIVYQDEVRVEHYRRDENAWHVTVLPVLQSILHLSALLLDIPLSAVYARTGLNKR